MPYKDPLKRKLYLQEYHKNRPWLGNYKATKERCLSETHDNYKYYGERGIKFLLKPEDFKFLWFRDKAYLMKKPSIDRKDNDGNYTLENSQFIELRDNLKKSHKYRQYNRDKKGRFITKNE